jgi:hypothetical protein
MRHRFEFESGSSDYEGGLGDATMISVGEAGGVRLEVGVAGSVHANPCVFSQHSVSLLPSTLDTIATTMVFEDFSRKCSIRGAGQS